MSTRRTTTIFDPLHSGLKEKLRERRHSIERLAKPSMTGAAHNDIRPTLKLQEIRIDALQLPSRQLRKMEAAHVRDVANSIATSGFIHPVLVGRNKLLIDGLVRVEAAKLQGLASIPCIRVDHLSDTEQRRLRLAVNRLQEKGRWELEALKLEFEEQLEFGEPVETTGFTLDEIDSILSGGRDLAATDVGPLEPISGSIAIVQMGDTFLLGPHKIVCGDARDPATMFNLMANTPARLVLTDQPYNVAIAGHVTGGEHREFAMATGEMTTVEFVDFNVNWMKVALDHLCDGGLLATFIDYRGLSKVQAAAEILALALLTLVVWAKTNAGMGSLYRSQHELLPIFKKGAQPHVNNIKLGKKGRWRSNVWTYPGASSIGSDARRGLQEHPTVKPTSMLEDALLDITHRGDVVLDPFLGSGSTLIACENTSRVCRGVEIDPLYVEVIIHRYETLTGKSAVLKDTGETLASLSQRRRIGGSNPAD